MATQQISGAISGLDTASIIESLMSIEGAKVDLVQEKVDNYNIQLKCYQSVNSLLATYSNAVSSLADADLWSVYTGTSSNESVLTATADDSAVAGSYTFQVLQLAQATQYMSAGFSDKSETAVAADGAGTISLDSAKAAVTSETALSTLNGGKGVTLGKIKLTDMSGNSATVDLSTAVTIDDVINLINDADVDIEASLNGSGLKLTDTSGGAGTLRVANVSGSSAATSLGIAGANSAGVITGSNLRTLAASTELSALRDGLGVAAGYITIADATSGNSWTVDLTDATTLKNVISAISSATGGQVTAAINTDGTGLVVTGQSGMNLTIASVGSTTTAEDLGLAATSAGETVTGAKLLADLDSVQIASLSGVNGTGLNGARGDLTQALGTFAATVGSTTVSFDLSALAGDDSLSDVLAELNSQAAAQLGEGALVFSVNSAGNGIQAENYTGATVSFSDVSGTAAADLGLTAASVADNAVLNGGDLDLNYLSGSIQLSTLNGGDGVAEGSILVTDASGFSAEIDLSNAETLADVIDAINSAGLDLVASINSTGDGLLLTSTNSSATGQIEVEEVDDGTTAADLGILGQGATNASGYSALDGSFELSVEIDTDDTLTDVMTKLSALSTKLSVSIVNDGSSSANYRLVVAGKDTGDLSGFILDTDLEAFNFTRTATAQDAVILYGDSTSGTPVAMRSATNSNSSAVLGLTLNLNAVSDTAVTVTVARDTDSIVTAFETFVNAYNSLTDLVNQLDQYVSEEDQEDQDEDSIAGLLYADSATRQMMNSLRESIFTRRTDTGDMQSLFDLGLAFGRDDDDDDATSDTVDEEDENDYYSTLTLDTDTLEDWLENHFEDVQSFMVGTQDAASAAAGATVIGAKAASSSTAIDNVIDDERDTYYQAADTIANGANTITVSFAEPTVLDYLVIYHVDGETTPAKEYALSDFTVEYLDASTGEWTTLRTISDNTSASTTIGLAENVTAQGIRITASATNAADDVMRLAEIKCVTSTGAGVEMERVASALTDSDTGYYATRKDTIDGIVDDLNDTIDDMNDRLDAKEAQLWSKFTAMETALANLQSQSESLSSMLDSSSSDD